MKILNFGSLNLDFVYSVDHFVKPGETVSAENMKINPGGKGLNQSVALARAGAQVFHAGCYGAGGEKLLSLLKENGVNTSFLFSAGEQQGNAFIQVVPSGENSIVVFPGSNHCISEEQICGTLSHFDEGDYLLLQNEINRLPQIVEQAYERGMRIILNPSPYNEVIDVLDFGKLSWLFVNEVEAEQISGCKDAGDAWEKLHSAYPELSVLFTLGNVGSRAYSVTGGTVEMVWQEAFCVDAVDTTGAGDTYTGFFIGGLMQKLPIRECMKRASMAAALGVMKSGAAASIPTIKDVTAALAAQ